MIPEHTPGPWRTHPGSAVSSWNVRADDLTIAFCPTNTSWGDLTRRVDEPHAKANARLIAAAPDLLDACEAIAAEASIAQSPEGDDILVIELTRSEIDMLRAAIAKARGHDTH